METLEQGLRAAKMAVSVITGGSKFPKSFPRHCAPEPGKNCAEHYSLQALLRFIKRAERAIQSWEVKIK